MSRLLQIAQLGHPVLRQAAQPVRARDIGSPAIQQLIDDMIATCIDVDGLGLAAPQVYQSLRIFIMAPRPSARYPMAPAMEPMAIVNPTIEAKSTDTETLWEGCLSIPGIRGEVCRPRGVSATFTDRHGIEQKKTFDGFLARIFYHEFDHLEGRVFLDVTDSSRLVTEDEYQKIVARASTET
jgi:peptide deformylase